MPLADKISPAPRAVRMAGAITALPGFVLLALAILLVVEATSATSDLGNIAAEVLYYVVLGAGTLACASGLLLGKTWARSPAVVVALILIGVGWYATGPSGQPGFGIPVGVAGLAVIILLFRRPSRAWALGMREGETEQEAAERGGAAGRAARRERGGGGDGE